MSDFTSEQAWLDVLDHLNDAYDADEGSVFTSDEIKTLVFSIRAIAAEAVRNNPNKIGEN